MVRSQKLLYNRWVIIEFKLGNFIEKYTTLSFIFKNKLNIMNYLFVF